MYVVIDINNMERPVMIDKDSKDIPGRGEIIRVHEIEHIQGIDTNSTKYYRVQQVMRESEILVTANNKVTNMYIIYVVMVPNEMMKWTGLKYDDDIYKKYFKEAFDKDK